MGLLDGRFAVVTGAAQGIGFAIARRLGQEGAQVVLADLDQAVVEEAAAGLAAEGIRSVGLRCDVTVEADVQALIERSLDLGGLDVYVNNAGITRDATIRNMSMDQFRAVLDVHLVGCWLGVKYASIAMRERGGGSIVNLSSISGKVGILGQTNYSAAKAGIVGMTKAAAKELAHVGVRVNAVQPGVIRTAMTEALPKDVWDAKVNDIPMRRAGEPSEVADTVLFLSSGLSSYMTGAVLEVTGGRHM